MHRPDWSYPRFLPAATSPSPTSFDIFDPPTFPSNAAPPLPAAPASPPPPAILLHLPTPPPAAPPATPAPTSDALPLPLPLTPPLAPPLPPRPLQPTTRDNFRSPTRRVFPPSPLPIPPNIDDFSPAQRRELRRRLRRARGLHRRLRPRHLPAGPSDNRPNPVPSPPPSGPTAGAAPPRPSDALDKKTARVIRNREVALRARQAAKAKLHNLESENSTLRNRAEDLENENSTLKRQIESLRRGVTPSPHIWPSQDVAMEGVVHSVNR